MPDGNHRFVEPAEATHIMDFAEDGDAVCHAFPIVHLVIGVEAADAGAFDPHPAARIVGNAGGGIAIKPSIRRLRSDRPAAG